MAFNKKQKITRVSSTISYSLICSIFSYIGYGQLWTN